MRVMMLGLEKEGVYIKYQQPETKEEMPMDADVWFIGSMYP